MGCGLGTISTFRRLGAEVAKPLAWSMSFEALGELTVIVLWGDGGELGGVRPSPTRDEPLLRECSILAMKSFSRGGEPRRGEMRLVSATTVRLGGVSMVALGCWRKGLAPGHRGLSVVLGRALGLLWSDSLALALATKEFCSR